MGNTLFDRRPTAAAPSSTGGHATQTCVARLLPDASHLARFARGISWNLVGTVFARGIGLVSSMLVARFLGKSGFGQLGTVQSTVGTLGLFAGLAMGLTATKHVAELRSHDPSRTGRIVALSGAISWIAGSLVSVALFVGAPWLASKTLAAPELTGALRASALLVLLNAVNGAQNGALNGFEAFAVVARANVLSALIGFPVMLAGAAWFSVTGAVWGLVANLGINCLFKAIAVRKEARTAGVSVAYRECHREIPVLTRFSLPAVLGGVVGGPLTWLCAAVLVNHPGGYGQMGLFSAANQWRTAILFVPGTAGAIAMPMLAHLNGDREGGGHRRFLRFSIVFTGLIALIPSVCVAALSWLIMAGYGPEFREGAPVLLVLALVAFVQALADATWQAMIAAGRVWSVLLLNCLWGGVLVLTFAVLFPGRTALSLALALLAAFTAQLVLQLPRVLRAQPAGCAQE